MKKEYPNFRSKGLEYLRSFLSEKDKRTLEDFKEYLGITAGEAKIKILERQLLQFHYVTEISFDKMNLIILRKYLQLLNKADKATETKNDIKKTLKRFLKWKYKDWSQRFDELRDIKTSDGVNYKKLNPSTILTHDELMIIIRSIESLTYKALVLLMFESAARPEEVVKLKWKDIDFVNNTVTLHSSKTKRTRVNPIHKSIPHLKRYKEECFFPPALHNDFVFPSPYDRNKSLATNTLNDLFNRIEKKLNFKKHLFPYLLRHTRLTELHKKLSSKSYEKFAGHSIEVAIKRYTHLNNDDVREEMMSKVYGVEELDKMSNEKILVLEDRIARLESVLSRVIDRANLVFNEYAMPT